MGEYTVIPLALDRHVRGGCVPLGAAVSCQHGESVLKDQQCLKLSYSKGVPCVWSGGARFQIRFSVAPAFGGTPPVNFHMGTLTALQHAFRLQKGHY